MKVETFTILGATGKFAANSEVFHVSLVNKNCKSRREFDTIFSENERIIQFHKNAIFKNL